MTYTKNLLSRSALALTALAFAYSAVAAEPATSSAPAKERPLFPAMKDNIWGMIDAAGNWVIQPRCDSFGGDVDGPTDSALIPALLDGQWVYLDRQDQVVLTVGPGVEVHRPLKGAGDTAVSGIHYCNQFREGRALFASGTRQMEDIATIHIGILDANGNVIVKPQFALAQDFSDGLAAVSDGKTWQYLDRQGKRAFELDLNIATPFAGGKAVVRSGKTWLIIDKTGKTLASLGEVENARLICDDRIAFLEKGKWGFFDAAGKRVIPAQFELAEDFHEGVALVWSGLRSPSPSCQVIDRQGKPVSKERFAQAYNASEGLVPVQVGPLWGYLGTDGKMVIEPQFTSAGRFSEGLAAVQINHKWAYINTKGQKVIEPDITYGGPFTRGLARVKHSGGDAWMNREGKLVVSWKQIRVIRW